MISIDAGSREMYKWIKGADLYDEVWKNIGEYAKVQYYPNLVQTKYIIIPEINDDKEEIIKYYEQTEKYGLKSVAFDIELVWYGENVHNLPESLYDFVEFTYNEAHNRGLEYVPVDRIVPIIRKIKNQKSEIEVKFRGKDI
jgi:pyruvate-formate lyase-activating enzyme